MTVNEQDTIPYHKPFQLDVDFSDIFESGMYTNDKYCRELERKIGDMYKCTCYTCSSGTQGLLIAAYIYLTSERISLSAFNWWSDQYIMKFLKKDIIYRDIDKKRWCIEYWMPTHLRLHTFGNTDPFPTNTSVFDGTHSLGAKFKTLGLATVISLAPTKMITAGEGGLILLPQPNDRIKEYRDKCCRMSEFHAKIGLEYLSFINGFLMNKKRIYDYYKANIPGQFQEIPYSSNYNTIGFLNLEKLVIPKHIETRQYYEPLQRGLKNTEYVYDNIVCLPSYYNCPYKQIVDDILSYNKRG